MSPARVGVLVIDPSMVMCHLIAKQLEAAEDLAVVGVARDRESAIELAARERPEVVTVDPLMEGEEASATLGAILAERHVRVVLVSAGDEEESRASLHGLPVGTMEFVSKPRDGVSGEMTRLRQDVVAAVRRAAAAGRRGEDGDRRLTPSMMMQRIERPPVATPTRAASRLVVIGTSTGGPAALRALVPRLAPEIDAAIIIIQHMPHSFTRSLAKRLDGECQIRVREADDGDLLAPGIALMAPGDYHLVVGNRARVYLHREPPVHGVRPSLDVTLESAARHYGQNLLTVILTGMGVDGARGAAEVKTGGGTVFAEDASTCVVYGMPRAVVEAGAADRVVPLHEMSEEITSWIHARGRTEVQSVQPMKMPATS